MLSEDVSRPCACLFVLAWGPNYIEINQASPDHGYMVETFPVFFCFEMLTAHWGMLGDLGVCGFDMF